MALLWRTATTLRRHLSESITLIVLSAGGLKSKRLSFPRGALYGLLLPLATCLLLLLIVAVWSGTLLRDARQARGLRVEVERLRQENSKIASLQAELDELATTQARVLAWAGLRAMTGAPEHTEDAAARPQPESTLALPGADTLPPGPEQRTDRLPVSRPGWAWPVAGWISRGYGASTGQEPAHLGLDIVVPRGTPVTAAAAGVVTFAGWDDELGNMVVIDHEGGVSGIYGHNTELLVSRGARVAHGQLIARAGSTGRSSAPHLHFELHRDGSALDPAAYLTGKSPAPAP